MCFQSYGGNAYGGLRECVDFRPGLSRHSRVKNTAMGVGPADAMVGRPGVNSRRRFPLDSTAVNVTGFARRMVLANARFAGLYCAECGADAWAT